MEQERKCTFGEFLSRWEYGLVDLKSSKTPPSSFLCIVVILDQWCDELSVQRFTGLLGESGKIQHVSLVQRNA